MKRTSSIESTIQGSSPGADASRHRSAGNAGRSQGTAVWLLASCLLSMAVPAASWARAASRASRPEEMRSPDSQAAARRLLILGGIYSARLFPDSRDVRVAEVFRSFEEERLKIIAWMRQEKLWDDASSWEKGILDTAIGKLSIADKVRILRQREGIAMLLYSLGLLGAMPSFEREFRLEPADLKKFPGVGMPTAAFISAARLRPREDLERGKTASEFWFVRGRTEENLRAGEFPKGSDFKEMAGQIREELQSAGLEAVPIPDGPALLREMVRLSAHWAFKDGFIPSPVDGDFPVNRKPYRELSKKDHEKLQGIAAERQRVFQWLEGAPKASGWDELVN